MAHPLSCASCRRRRQTLFPSVPSMARPWQTPQYRSPSPEFSPTPSGFSRNTARTENDSSSSTSSRRHPTARIDNYDLSFSPQGASSTQDPFLSSHSFSRPSSEQQKTRSSSATSRLSYDGSASSGWVRNLISSFCVLTDCCLGSIPQFSLEFHRRRGHPRGTNK